MNQEQITIGYDEFMPQPFKDRHKIFNEISAENRAFLMRTHVERWLAANRSQINSEQIAFLEKVISQIRTELYEEDRNQAEVEREGEAVSREIETIFSKDEMRQIVTLRAEYIPLVEVE